MRWQNMRSVGLVMAAALSSSCMGGPPKTYLIGTELKQQYIQEELPGNSSMVEVYFNYKQNISVSCADNQGDCWLVTIAENTGDIDFTPMYGVNKTTAQLLEGPSDVVGYLEIVYLSDIDGEPLESQLLNPEDNALYSQYTIYQPITVNVNQDILMRALECGSQFDSVNVMVYTDIYEEGTTNFSLSLITLSDDGTEWMTEIMMDANHRRSGPNDGAFTPVLVTGAKVPSECMSGQNGLILNVALSNDAEEPYQYYNVWGLGMLDRFMVYQFGDYEPMIKSGDSDTIKRFNTVATSVSQTGLPIPMMIMLSPLDADFYGDDDTTELYILGCAPPYIPSDYLTLGWFSQMMLSNSSEFVMEAMVLPTGTFTYDSYYYPYPDTSGLEDYISDNTYLQFLISTPENQNNKTLSITEGGDDAFTLSNTNAQNGDLEAGDTATFAVNCALNISTTVQYEFLKGPRSNLVLCSESSSDGVTGHFVYTQPDYQWQVEIPKACDGSAVSIRLSSMPCDDEDASDTTYNTVIGYDLKSSDDDDDDGLSVGAIIGIVCAVVLVVGLGAWWFLMRRSRDQPGYSSMD